MSEMSGWKGILGAWVCDGVDRQQGMCGWVDGMGVDGG